MALSPRPARGPTYQPTRASARTLRTTTVTAKRITTPPRLLVVDDDPRYGQWLGHHLGVFCPESTVTVLNLVGFERWCETDSGRDCDILLLTASFGSSPEDPKARGLE